MSQSSQSSQSKFISSLNPKFLKNLDTYFGERALVFLTGLPDFIKRYEALWDIEVFAPVPNLSINFVAPALGKNGERYIFKCGVPNREFDTEIDTLRHFAGIGLPKLIHASKEDAVLLQERIEPGVSLREVLRQGELSDVEATEVGARAVKDYLKQASKPLAKGHSFPHIRDWLKAFEVIEKSEQSKVFPYELLEFSFAKLPDLLGSIDSPMDSQVLLHGDLHHDNIISKGDSWMVIDPKGIIGDKSYEIGAFLRNPHELVQDSNLKNTIQKRIEIFSDVLELDAKQITAWMIVQSVLSVWWSIEEDDKVKAYSDLDKGSHTVLQAALFMCDAV